MHAHFHLAAADADLATRVIKSKSASAFKYIALLVALAIVTTLLTFGHFPRSINHEYSYRIIYNQGSVEVASMSTQFMASPLLFMTKFTIKSLVYKGRTVVIKMPLVRHVMPKRGVRGFLRRRAEGRSRSMSMIVSSRIEPEVSAD